MSARPASALAAIALVLLASACGRSGGQGAQGVDRWLDVVNQEAHRQPPADDTMQLNLSAGCRLVAEFDVAGARLNLVGSGTSLYGSDAPRGVRYQCAWSGDETNDRPANARLEAIELNDQAEMDQYRTLVLGRSNQVAIRSSGYVVYVAEVLPAPSGARTFDAEILLEDRMAAVRLLLEVTDPSVAMVFDAGSVASTLTRYTGKRPSG